MTIRRCKKCKTEKMVSGPRERVLEWVCNGCRGEENMKNNNNIYGRGLRRGTWADFKSY